MIFENGEARIIATAEGDFEKRLLGVLVNPDDVTGIGVGGLHCEALVTLDSRAHISYGKVDEANIVLRRSTPSTPSTRNEK